MKFLVGYNDTDSARAALEVAREQAGIYGAHVIVITSMGGGRTEKPEAIGAATSGLEYAQKFLEEKGISCEVHQLARGRTPGEDLITFAEEHGVGQIYVGIKKVSRTQKILLGSNAQFVILKASCPVVTVRSLS